MKTRAYLVLGLAVVGCVRNYEVPRRDWGLVENGTEVYVRTHGGDAFELDSFAFTVSALVAVHGHRVSPADESLGQPIQIPLDSLAVVRVRRFDPGRTAALAFGISALATAGVIMIADSKDPVRPQPVPRPATGSCPFIYSFDGSRWVFDSETYAGAVARGLERTDVDNLDHIRPVGGSYRLAMANELDETQYTDELSLLVADHPSGTRVFTEASGAAHVVGRGIRPLQVAEFGDRDSLLTRAGWEVVFARPEGLERAALVITARNGPIISFVTARMLSLMGPAVYSWYAAMNTDSASRDEMTEWIREETYLHAHVWKHGSWHPIAALPAVGPSLSKTQIVTFDLREHVGDTIRVKLEATPLVWKLETIELAPDLGPATLRQAVMLRAQTEDSRDVTGLLSVADGKYHVALNGSRVELEFRAPSDAGPVRTVLARATGHYYIAADDTDRSQLHVALRIMTDTQFARRYFLSAWDEAVAQHGSLPEH
jgi:hypothetical protein